MDDIIKTVSETLEKEVDVLALFLFGSRARDESKKDSDYDFYVILDKNAKDSLREDEIYRKVHGAAKEYKPEIHLTFQYLFIVNEDKSLILKISTEGRLIFSKTYLIAPYRQFGLQRYYICRWGIGEKRVGSGNREEFVRNKKLLINRMLYGYTQKYAYKGKQKASTKGGLVDNKAIFGDGEIIILPDIMFDHIKYFIEKNKGSIAVTKILNSCYIPTESIDDIEVYHGKKEMEKFIRTRNKIGKALFVTSAAPFGSDKVYVKFECVGEEGRRNTIIPIKELPQEMQKNIIAKRKYDFV